MSTFKFESVCCSICVQNVLFSNGVLESHGEVWWWQLSPFESSKCARFFLNMGFGNFLMGVPPYQVKKLQVPITTTRRWRLFALLSVHLTNAQFAHINIVTMWKLRGRLFVVCMKLRQLVTSCSFKADSSPSKCKNEMTCLCTSTQWKPLRTNFVPSMWTLRVKMFTWYSSWAYLHPLIT